LFWYWVLALRTQLTVRCFVLYDLEVRSCGL